MGDQLNEDYAAAKGLPPWAHIVKPAQLRDADVTKALRAVSAWATRYCYLPCDYEMCAAFLRSKDNDLVAYVVPRDRSLSIPPEAMVRVAKDLDACPEHIFWHSGCARRRHECQMPE